MIRILLENIAHFLSETIRIWLKIFEKAISSRKRHGIQERFRVYFPVCFVEGERTMKKLILFLLITLSGAAFPLSAVPPERNWFTDFGKAQQEAQTKKLPMFLLFTGSDWCPWCVKLRKESLDTKEFKEYVAKDAIFLYLDFPSHVQLPKRIKEQNANLARRYGVNSFPTTVIINADGDELGRIYGFRPIADYLKELKAAAARK